MQTLYSPEAEDGVVGGLLINPGDLMDIDLDPMEFWLERNRVIYEAMLKINLEGSQIDFLTVSETLKNAGKLEIAGGLARLTGLINDVPSSFHTLSYAKIIRKMAQRRKMEQVAVILGRAAHADDEQAMDDAVATAFEELTVGFRPTTGSRHIKYAISALIDQVAERMKDPKAIWGLETGMSYFDNATGGFQPGEVFLLAGEPGVGKSILGNQFGLMMAEKGAPGAIYTLEMQEIQIARRSTSAKAKIATRKLKSGDLTDAEFKKFLEAAEYIASLPVYLYDDSRLTTMQLRADLAMRKRRDGIQWFVVDYLYLLGDKISNDGDETARTEALSRRVKQIAKELDLAAVAIASVTKQGMGQNQGTRGMAAVRGSGQILHDADVIAFLTEHDPLKSGGFAQQKNKNMRTLSFEKGRELESVRVMNLVKQADYPFFLPESKRSEA